MHISQSFHPARFAVLAALLFTAVAAQARYVPKECKNEYSVQEEIALGQQYESRIFRDMPVLSDYDPLVQYVSTIGLRLAQFAPGYRWPFRFHIINVPEINAYTLPGGVVFINMGAIQAAENEAQLAGILAHEIAHAQQRHITCNMTRADRNILYNITGPGLISALTFLHMSREMEKQADLMGADILFDAGYDPDGMPQFFQIIQDEYGNGGAQILRDHPNPGNRIQYINEEIASLPPRHAPDVRNTANFNSMHRVAMEWKPLTMSELRFDDWRSDSRYSTHPVDYLPAENISGGRLDASSWQPSGDWAAYDTATSHISQPGNWVSMNGPGRASTIAPPGGTMTSKHGHMEIAYGVMIDVFKPKNSATSTEDAFVQLVEALNGTPQEVAQSGIKPLTEIQHIQLNSSTGAIQALSQEFQNISPIHVPPPTSNATPGAVGAGNSEDDALSSAAAAEGPALAERDWIVAVARDDHRLAYLVFIAP